LHAETEPAESEPAATEPAATEPAAGERWTPRRGATSRLLAAELRLVLGRRRNQVFVAGLGLVPALLGLMLYLTRDDPHAGEGPGFLTQATNNGVFLVVASLFMCLPFLLPLTVALAAGDAVAGEASAGTLRYLLVLPVSRSRLLIAKAVGALALVAVAVVVVAAVGLIVGAALFGLHDVVLLSGTTVPLSEGMARVLGVVVYIGLSLTGLIAVGLFASTLTEVPIAAMVATVVVAVVSAILDSLPALSSIHPYLLTHYWYGFAELLRLEVDWNAVGTGLGLQVAWIVVFGALAWSRFTQSNISS
jgi:ABC-2 type transport system permease protein